MRQRHLVLDLLVIALALTANATSAQGWEADRRLTWSDGHSETSINFARSVAADDRGRVHVTWADERDGNREIYYQRSIDGGVEWGPPIRLTKDAAASVNPSIAAEANFVHVAWWDDRDGSPKVYVRSSRDAGATWGAKRRISQSPGAAFPSIAVQGSRVFVVYVDVSVGHAEVYFTRSLDQGNSWATPVRLSALPWSSYTPTVAASGGNVYVAWTDTRVAMTVDTLEEEYFRHSADGGITWDLEVRLTRALGNSWAPSLAAQGEEVGIAWFDDRSGDWEIYFKRSTDGGLTWSVDRRLTRSAGPSLRPSLARYGSALHLAYWDHRDGDEEIYWLTSPDRGKSWSAPQRLTVNAASSVRPSVAAAASGVHIVWTDERDGDSEVYYKRLPGSAVRVGNGRIAFTGEVGGSEQVFTVNADGGDERQLTFEGANQYPAWSKDGSRLAFSSNRTGDWKIWVMEADGSRPHALTAAVPGGHFVPDWSHDGARLAFASIQPAEGRPDIWTIRADGSGARRLTFSGVGTFGSLHPSWSPSDERIYFGSGAGGDFQVWGMYSDGQGQEQKTAGLGPGYPQANVPAFAPRGERFAFWSGIEGQYGEIWTLDLAEPTGPRRLTDTSDPHSSDNPSWSPDGAWILFDSNRSGATDIWVMAADGSGARPLFSGSGQTSWQPVTGGVGGIVGPHGFRDMP